MLSSQSSRNRSKNAEAFVVSLFESEGWNVQALPTGKRHSPDLIVQKGARRFVVEIKAHTEGRADRVIPSLAQAILEVQANARDAGDASPLAVICAENVSRSLLNHVSSFVRKYAPGVAVGVVSESGLRRFEGAGLEELNAEPEESHWHDAASSNQTINLFSDLNQWMLKILLAPEIPELLLAAPRNRYEGVSALAEAAKVSNMSASRFVQQLRNEGYLKNSSRYLVLVRRAELFRRWRSAVMRLSLEIPMRFLIRGSVQQQIRGLLASHDGEACLGLFAAADALQIGHVSGVPAYVNVSKAPKPNDKKWRALVAAPPSETPDLILKQALSPKSTLRGAVRRDGLIVSDVIQVWLDVVNHPSRGEEQAELIYRKILRQIIETES